MTIKRGRRKEEGGRRREERGERNEVSGHEKKKTGTHEESGKGEITRRAGSLNKPAMSQL